MNQDTLKGKWHEWKGDAKIKWAQLTDDDIDLVDGNAEKLVGILQQRYGYAKDRAQQEVDAWMNRQAPVSR
jgi:uncharacterized protein YjbJ (UPF0337 family)